MAAATAAAALGGGSRMQPSPFASLASVDTAGTSAALQTSASAANLQRTGTESAGLAGSATPTVGADLLAVGLPSAVSAGDVLAGGGDCGEDSPLPGTPRGSTAHLSSLAASIARHQQQQQQLQQQRQLGAGDGASASEPGGGLGPFSAAAVQQYSVALPSMGSLGSPLLPVMPPGPPGGPAAMTGGGLFVGGGSRRSSFRAGSSTFTGSDAMPPCLGGMGPAATDSGSRPASGRAGLAAAQSARLLHSATRQNHTQLLSPVGHAAPSPVASLSNVLLMPCSPRRASALAGEADEIESYLAATAATGAAASSGAGSFARRSETSLMQAKTAGAADGFNPVGGEGSGRLLGTGPASGHGYVSGGGGRTMSRMRRDSSRLSYAGTAGLGGVGAGTGGVGGAAGSHAGVSMGATMATGLTGSAATTSASGGSFRRLSNSTHSTGLVSPVMTGSGLGLRAAAAAGAAAAAAGPLSPVP